MTAAPRRVALDRVGSCTAPLRLPREVVVGPDVVAEEGYVLAVRLLNDKAVYNRVEDPSGRFVRLRRGDVLAGALGRRRALRGYAGEVPESLRPGDVVQVLNLGGVLGRCTAGNPDLGPPFDAEVLGAVLRFPPGGDRVGAPAHLSAAAVPPADRLTARVPLVLVAGTCMDAGKTVAATEIVRGLSRAGRRVGALKLTGVALRRDALSMLDAGAVAALTFNDAGVVSTDREHVLPTAYGLVEHIARTARPDVVVAELGDGILGEYGVDVLLADEAIAGRTRALVVCAPDQVAAWGAVRLLEERWGLRATVVSGPATDNEVGCRFVREQLGLPAHNARRDGEALVAAVAESLDA